MATTTFTGTLYGTAVYGTDIYGIGGVTIVPDGVQATGTTDSGLVISADANHVVIGVQGTGAVGLVGSAIVADANIGVTGVEATSSAGTITHKTVNRIPVSGIEATGAAGTLGMTGDSNFAITAGVEGTGQVGTVTPVADANVAVTGVAGTTAINAAGVVVGNNAIPTFSGVVGTGAAGTVTVSPTVTVFDPDNYSRARAVRLIEIQSSRRAA